MKTAQPGPVQSEDALEEAKLQKIAHLVEEIKNVHGTKLVEQKRRQLDEEIQRFRIQLGLQGQYDETLDPWENPGLTEGKHGPIFVPEINTFNKPLTEMAPRVQIEAAVKA